MQTKGSGGEGGNTHPGLFAILSSFSSSCTKTRKGLKVGVAAITTARFEDRFGTYEHPRSKRASINLCYSHRNTFAERAVQTTKTKASAATSPTCADHASPLQIPSSSDTV